MQSQLDVPSPAPLPALPAVPLPLLQGINTLDRKARNGLLSIDEMAGGTVIISNGGVYGIMLSTPIISPP